MGVLQREDVVKVNMDELLALATNFRGEIDRVYWHWTAGNYGQFWDSYHINIDEDGSVYLTTDDFTEIKSHTWKRNSRAIGVSCLCMAGASTSDFGDQPLTSAQIEASASVFAVLAIALNLPLDNAHFRTHAEQAIDDDYGPGSGDPETRWDGWILEPDAEMGSGGRVLRGKGNWYWNEYQSRLMKGTSLIGA